MLFFAINLSWEGINKSEQTISVLVQKCSMQKKWFILDGVTYLIPNEKSKAASFALEARDKMVTHIQTKTGASILLLFAMFLAVILMICFIDQPNNVLYFIFI